MLLEAAAFGMHLFGLRTLHFLHGGLHIALLAFLNEHTLVHVCGRARCDLRNIGLACIPSIVVVDSVAVAVSIVLSEGRRCEGLGVEGQLVDVVGHERQRAVGSGRSVPVDVGRHVGWHVGASALIVLCSSCVCTMAANAHRYRGAGVVRSSGAAITVGCCIAIAVQASEVVSLSIVIAIARKAAITVGFRIANGVRTSEVVTWRIVVGAIA